MFNVVGTIPGSELPNEYVVLSAHFDAWDGASGMTDNGLRVQTLVPETLHLHGRTLPATLATGPGHVMDATLRPTAPDALCNATASAGNPAGVL